MAVNRAAGRAEGTDQVEGLATEFGFIETSAHAQHAVAQGLEIQTATVGAPEQCVFGVLGDGVGAEVGGLQERVREDDRADELLHRPAFLYEGAREMVE